MLRTFRALTPIGLVVLALAVLANAVGIADGKGKPKAATLALTVTPNQVKTGTTYTVGLTGYSGRFTKLAVSGHKSPCGATVKQENTTHTIHVKVVPGKKNYDWVTKFTAGLPGTRHVCAYLYNQNGRGDTHQLHKSATYTSTP